MYYSIFINQLYVLSHGKKYNSVVDTWSGILLAKPLSDSENVTCSGIGGHGRAYAHLTSSGIAMNTWLQHLEDNKLMFYHLKTRSFTTVNVL